MKTPRRRKPKISKPDFDVDRISLLQDPIIHLILSFVPTIDAVRTSLLSRRWRYLWTSVPCLDFDHCYFWSRHLGSVWYNSEFGAKFTSFVTGVLSFRDGSDITRFRLSCFTFCQNWVDKWIVIVASHNVQELDLTICPEKKSFLLAGCPGMSRHLTTLKLNLYNHILELPDPIDFVKLTNLHLRSLRFSNGESARRFSSGCPFLESLVLERCVYDNTKVLHISAANLKTLTIENVGLGDGGDDGLHATELNIFAPNLVFFKYIGPVARHYNLLATSSVSEVFIELETSPEKGSVQEIGHLMCKFINSFCNTKVMKLCTVFLKLLFSVLDENKYVPTSFYNLKVLELCLGDVCNLRVMVHLLKYSPNLEVLIIDFKASNGKGCWQPEDEVIVCLMHHLKTVKINNFDGQDSGLELIKFLLENCCALETLTISWSNCVEKPIEIIQKGVTILTFPQASQAVAIVFKP